MSDLVSRSVFLPVQHDALLRQLAHEHAVSKNGLIRAAVAAKLAEWQADPATLRRDLLASQQSENEGTP